MAEETGSVLGMNIEQIKSIAKPIIAFFGGIAVAKGWIPPGAVDWLTNNLSAILGVIATIATLVVGLMQNTKASVIAAAAKLPEVAEVKLTQSAPASLEQATPANVSK